MKLGTSIDDVSSSGKQRVIEETLADSPCLSSLIVSFSFTNENVTNVTDSLLISFAKSLVVLLSCIKSVSFNRVTSMLDTLFVNL